MVALQIRDVPEEVRDILAARARVRGQSLQAFLRDLVETEARLSQKVELLYTFSGRSDGIRSAPGEIAAELAAIRREREAELDDRC